MKTGHDRVRRAFAGLAAVCLVWADVASVAYAAPTDISNIPIAIEGHAKPNMILAVDDSGSMDFEYLPVSGYSTNDGALWWNTVSRSFFGYDSNDAWQGGGATPTAGGTGFFGTTPPAGPVNFNQVGNASAEWRKYVYLFPNGQCGANCDTRSYADGAFEDFAVPPTREFGWVRSAAYNAQYYNPAVRYDPWRPFNNGTTTTTPVDYDGSAGSWTSVRSHPVYPTTGSGETMDLTTVAVPASDDVSKNRIFVMFAGMILPPGARYRICRHDGAFCGDWKPSGSTVDRCIVEDDTVQTASYCHFAGVYGVTATIAVGAATTGAGLTNRIEAQIPYFPATYWVPSTGTGALAPNEAYGPDGRRIARVEIRTGNSFARASGRTDCQGSTCTYAEEMTNFANWWAYDRKRHMMLNAALGSAFDDVKGLRAGSFQFNNLQDVTMRDFDSASDTDNGRRLLYDLYRSKGTASTPTRPALEFAGRQYERTGDGAPITAACQYNAALVITDGFARSIAPPTDFGNADADSSNRFTIPYDPTDPALNYKPAGDLPRPPADITSPPSVTPASPFADAEDNTLADISMHFYSTNLRPDMAIRQVPINQNDTAKNADRNDYLHMNTYALGLGVQGFIFGRSDTDELKKNNDDPYTITSWPPVRTGSGYVLSPATIDELWHATVDGRGRMLSASSPEETRLSVIDIVNNIGAKGGAGAAVSVANPNVSPGDNYSYASSYNSGAWSGDINKFAIDLQTGVVDTTPLWSPTPQQQLATTPPGQRVIVTYNDAASSTLGTSAGIPFQWSSLSSTQRGHLTSTVRNVTSADSEVLDFLRGDRSREGDKFRSRGARPLKDASGAFIVQNGRYVYAGNTVPADIAVLGDIIDAEPVVVRQPRFSYFDPGYQEFRAANASRAGVLYQGANDGMLHAFDVNTGKELWAYVPGLVYPNLANLADRERFSHHYFVDGTPAVGDVDFSTTGGASSGTPAWHTLLVGGLRKGGFGFYALDVTNGQSGTETTVANRVLWEFPSAGTDAQDPSIRANVGYSFGRPIIAKTRAAGWVVIVTSGYNNGTDSTATGSSGGDGKGYLYVLNPRNGNVIATLTTNAGTPDNPSDLAYVSAFAQRPDVDATIEAVYGGDLFGNVWRFDLSGATVSSWSVSKLAELRAPDNGVQPVTSEPELGVIQGKRVVFVGTGQYLGESDALNSPTVDTERAQRTMSMYALRDDLAPGGTTSPLIPTPTRDQLVTQTVTKTGTSADITQTPVDFRAASTSGWVLDFPTVGERLVANPVLSSGVLSLVTITPDNADPCSPGGSSWIYFLDFATGGRVIGATFAGIRIGNVLASRAVLVRVRDGIVGIVRTSGGSSDQNGGIESFQQPSPPSGSTGHRISWREIPDTFDAQ
ncbi:MAG: PQQ-binding-like beta-propeller repeat protein [Betaproteobacteria bacterium]|nr:PQQ-binding-like beta-propeller repeat protein [Betaproteobacteria bacterium]